MSAAHFIGALTFAIALGTAIAYAVAATVKPREARTGWSVATIAVMTLALMGPLDPAFILAGLVFAVLAALKVRMPGLTQ